MQSTTNSLAEPDTTNTAPSDPHSLPRNDTTDNQSQPQPLSKKAQKKLRKAEYFAERKLERRAREKEKKKEKKRERAERLAAGEHDDEDDESNSRAKKRAKLAHSGPRNAFGATVVVDLGFDDKMSEKEVGSLCSQLAYTYSANRHAETYFSNILYTSLNGRTLTRLESMNDAGYKRWTGTEWWSEDYEDLWRETPASTQDEVVTGEGASKETTSEGIATTPGNPAKRHASTSGGSTSRATASKESVVYLTADSSDELQELKEGETYIIGGICDHNRYKNLCLNKAKASGIRAARLPIGRYLTNLPTRKVLTVNQAFEILLKWVETKDWEQAFYAVIPKRKFQQGGTAQTKGEVEHEEGEGDEGKEEEDRVADENDGEPLAGAGVEGEVGGIAEAESTLEVEALINATVTSDD